MTEPAPKREAFWYRWLVKPVATQLLQGTQPRKVAQAIAFGVTIGIFPVLGTPTALSLVIGIPLRLNQPVVQVFRELAYPLQLATVLLFIRAGEWLFGIPHTPLSLSLMFQRFFAGPLLFLKDYGMLALYAVVVWLLMAPLLLALLYGSSLPLVKLVSNRLPRTPHAA